MVEVSFRKGVMEAVNQVGMYQHLPCIYGQLVVHYVCWHEFKCTDSLRTVLRQVQWSDLCALWLLRGLTCLI